MCLIRSVCNQWLLGGAWFCSWHSEVRVCGFQYRTEQNTARHLTYWGRVTHINISKLTVNGSDNALLIWPLGKKIREILIEIYMFSLRKRNAFDNVVCKMAAILSRPHCVKEYSTVTKRVYPQTATVARHVKFPFGILKKSYSVNTTEPS